MALPVHPDILPLILIHLPIESLLRFKSVSKSWCSLISSPRFCNKRTRFHLPPPSGIFLRSNPRVSDFHFVDLRYTSEDLASNSPSIPFEELHLHLPTQKLVIHQSCNGLLLCRNFGMVCPRTEYFIYNPTTKKHRQLELPEGGRVNIGDGFTLVFDPLRSTTYQVVWFHFDELTIEIYSSDTRSWNQCPTKFLQCPRGYKDGQYWNGGIYWPHFEYFFYLDLSTHEFLQLPMPNSESQSIEFFGVCCGRLHYIVCEILENVLCIFEMLGKHDGWLEKYRVDLREISSMFGIPGWEIPPQLPIFTVSAVVYQSEGDDDPYVVFQTFGTVLRLYVLSGRIEHLKLHRADVLSSSTFAPTGFLSVDSFLYIESLASV